MERKILLCGLLIVLLSTLPVAASTFVAMSSVDLVKGATAVIQGQVIEIESFWSDSGRIIVTEAKIEVDEVLLGRAPSTVTVRTFGGQVGDMIVEAHGFPKFEANERVLLFLTVEPADGTTRVLGYQQGQYRVVTRLDGVTLAVPMADEGMRLIQRSGKLAPEPQSLLLDDFRSRLRATALQVGRTPETTPVR